MNNPIHILNYWPNLLDKHKDLLKWEEKDDLVIVGYNEECQWSKAWDNITTQCRGLIFNQKTMRAVSYPFNKFFNLGEHTTTMPEYLPKVPFEVTEKLDGAMGVCYRDPQTGRPAIATRGSFVSEEGLWATQYLQRLYSVELNPERYTYIFEICAEGTQFRHVAMKKPGLYLIGMRSMYSFKELMPHEVAKHAKTLGFPVPEMFNKSIDQLLEEQKTIEATQCEGWVLHYENGLKVKIKGMAYMRLARFLQSFSPAHVFDMVMNGETPPDDLPADIYRECAELGDKFKAEFLRRLQLVDGTYRELEHITDRKEFAMAVQATPLPVRLQGAVFQKKDGKFEPRKMWEGMKKDEVWKTL